MTISRGDTDEGRGRGKVSTESRRGKGIGIYLLPLLMALPFVGVLILGALRFGPTVMKIIGIMIKLVVTA